MCCVLAAVTVPEPNLDTHVFCRVKEDRGNFEIDQDTLDLAKDDLLIVRYRAIQALLQEDSVELV